MKHVNTLTLCACLACGIAWTPNASAYSAEDKFLRGLAGMTTGVLELPGNIVKETNQQGPVGIPIGIAKGVGMIVARELVGVYEFLTAPFAAPPAFKPILQPDYPWDYFR